jgi:hypothetical protein
MRASATKPGVFLACLVLAAGVSSSACDSSTMPSLVAQKVILTVPTTPLPVQGGTVTIAASITNASDKPMAGVAVTFATTAGTFTPAATATSDANGMASVTLATTTAATVKASAMGVDSASSAISVKGQAALSVAVNVPSTSGDYPNGVDLPFLFTATRSGSIVSGTLVVAWGDGTANGSASFTGSATVTHKFAKGGTYSVSATLTETDGSRATTSSSFKIREGLDQIDISNAIMVSPMDDEGVTKWPIKSELTSIYVDTGQTCLDHTLNGKWPVTIFEPPDGGPLEGTHIIFANIGGKIYGGVYDYYRPGQTCKGTNKWQYGEEQIRSEPMGSWVPAKGEIVGFMASTPARGGYNTINERTYVKAFVFPY